MSTINPNGDTVMLVFGIKDEMNGIHALQTSFNNQVRVTLMLLLWPICIVPITGVIKNSTTH